MSTRRSIFLYGVCLGLAGSTGCGGPQAVRGEQVEGLDQEAFSTGLDKYDLQKMLHENMEALQGSPLVKRWEQENRPVVSVLPLRNETTEHVDSALQALISDIETTLVNAGHVRVVSIENQPALVEEIQRQGSGSYAANDVARWGQQIGARYLVTGKVFATDEREADERRVQYFMFLQVLGVETGEILFQNKTAVTKAMM
ncbi:penicillin-binding protein activator LpoB [Myxococcota bacterium]